MCVSVLFLISQSVPAHLLHVCQFYIHTPYDVPVFCLGVFDNLKIKFVNIYFLFVQTIPYFLKPLIICRRFQ
jgi:hypothetical protein